MKTFQKCAIWGASKRQKLVGTRSEKLLWCSHPHTRAKGINSWYWERLLHYFSRDGFASFQLISVPQTRKKLQRSSLTSSQVHKKPPVILIFVPFIRTSPPDNNNLWGIGSVVLEKIIQVLFNTGRSTNIKMLFIGCAKFSHIIMLLRMESFLLHFYIDVIFTLLIRCSPEPLFCSTTINALNSGGYNEAFIV